LKVLKFGGTSVGSADSMRKVINCVENNSTEGCVVLLSAVSGTTDKLLEAAKLSIINIAESLLIIEDLKFHHLKILNNLTDNYHDAYSEILQSYFDEITDKINAFNILGEVTPQNIDSLICYGEMLSTSIFYVYSRFLKFDFSLIDSRDFIKTNSEFNKAVIDFEKSRDEFNKNKDIFSNKSIIIAQGFIGSDFSGKSTTLGRGGSDYSASVFAYLLKSINIEISEIQIWTDVSGVLSADPRIVRNAVTINSMMNTEIRTLSYLGAKVLHPDTIKPAVLANIPVRVLNTFKPLDSGTLIRMENENIPNSINSLIQIENCTEIRVNPPADKSSFEIIPKIFNLTLESDCKPIFSSNTEDSILIIMKNYSEILKDSELLASARIDKISCIAITGSEVGFHLKKVIEIAEKFNLKFVGLTQNCIFLSSNEIVYNEDFNKLHDKLFIE
jgi:aspartokinase/homoserine dehydrogenase 1